MIQALEAVTRKLGCAPVFFCELYRDGDRLKGYPIECFTEWEGTP